MSESNPQITTVELGFVVAVEKVWEAPFALYVIYLFLREERSL